MSDLTSFRRNQLRVLNPVGIVFAMVPKAGNTSLRHAFHYALGQGQDFKETDDSFRIGKRLPASLVIPSSFTRMILVRNPWDRLRSCYTDKIARPRTRRGGTHVRGTFTRIGCWRGMPFDEFVRIVCATSDYEVDKHAMPIHYLLDNPEWGGKPDHIFRLEDPNMWRYMWHKFRERGAILPDRMPRANHTDRVKKPGWTPELVNLVGDRYADDIKILGYEGPTC